MIGFSVHKITLEILFGRKDFVKCLPYHEEFQIGENDSRQSLFFNQLYAGYLLLKENRVKFPTKFHYFKEKDVAKYALPYTDIWPTIKRTSIQHRSKSFT